MADGNGGDGHNDDCDVVRCCEAKMQFYCECRALVIVVGEVDELYDVMEIVIQN